jgi:DNA-binding SARP family transcriptional activator
VEHERPVDGAGSGEGLVVRLLGLFAVELGGRALGVGAFPRRKAHQLVKLLALQTGCKMHRDQVVEALWPHLPLDAGSHQLHNALAQARAAIRTLTGSEIDPVVVEAGVVALRQSGVPSRPPALPSSTDRRSPWRRPRHP